MAKSYAERGIFEASEIPESEKVYLKKGILGYRVVHPDKPVTGGRRMAVTLLIYLIIAIIIYFGVNELVSGYRDAAENPCDYCSAYQISKSGVFISDESLTLYGKPLNFSDNLTECDPTISSCEVNLSLFEGGENG